jgi:hypothetical protein
MKRILLIISILISGTLVQSQSVIFLHHSTGEGVYYEGNVAAWITNYNSTHGKNYVVSEMNYPNTPYPWQNYPYDYWYLWVNNQCSSTNVNTMCLSNILQSYDVVVFKHCFPGASIVADDGNPLVSSPTQTLANYKLQYRALRALMDQYPQKKFIVWTLTPLHRLATNVNDAARAREFVNWVKTSWLTEDGNSHPNIYVFDFYGLVAEPSATPANGLVNCLKYNYEKSHTDNDSHPNLLANQTVGPIFAQFLVNTIENIPSGLNTLQEDPFKVKIYPNPAKDFLTLDFSQIDDPVISLDVFDLQGKHLIYRQVNGEHLARINTGDLSSGVYMVKVNSKQASFVRKFTVLHP